jgi:hypothetical protein
MFEGAASAAKGVFAVGRASKRPRTAGQTGAGRPAQALTAGDLARLLQVDLKTIHNWVNQSYVFARRTEGRHLRFQRGEVVRFLRRFGHSVPAGIGRAAPRAFVQHGRLRAPAAQGGVEQGFGSGVFATVLAIADGSYEVVILDLDSLARGLTRELLKALRSRDETRGLSLIGVSRHATRRADFVRSGGDVSLAPGRPRDLTLATHFVTGGAAAPPKGAMVAGP